MSGKPHGGARPNAGRKPKPERRRTYSVNLTADEAQTAIAEAEAVSPDAPTVNHGVQVIIAKHRARMRRNK